MSHLRQEIFAQRRFRQLFLGLLTFSVLLGLLIVPLEAGQGYFQSFEDGLWWASTTVTGVGYGDLVPVTRLGRLVGVLLQITGVGMLGLMIGIVSDLMSQRQERIYWKREFNQFDELHDRLDKLESQVSYLVREHAQGSEPELPSVKSSRHPRQGHHE